MSSKKIILRVPMTFTFSKAYFPVYVEPKNDLPSVYFDMYCNQMLYIDTVVPVFGKLKASYTLL